MYQSRVRPVILGTFSLALGVATGLGISNLFDSKNDNNQKDNVEKEVIKTLYFAEVSKGYHNTSPCLTTGDFNNDGNLDFILAKDSSEINSINTRLYFFAGDGKGSFTLVEKTKEEKKWILLKDLAF